MLVTNHKLMAKSGKKKEEGKQEGWEERKIVGRARRKKWKGGEGERKRTQKGRRKRRDRGHP